MANPFEQEQPVKKNILEQKMSQRISQHSLEYDKKTKEERIYSPKEIREAWKVEEWRIGDATITAIGVAHEPETFLEYREQIEKTIQSSDMVVNEFTPEASGYYDSSRKESFKKIPSKINPDYNLEQLRQAFMEHERSSGLGSFHHEVELLAAKFGKDMACIDLMMRDPEIELQDSHMFYRMAEKSESRRAFLKQLGMDAVAASAGIIGLSDFLNKLSKKNLSRRNFLKSAGLMAGGLAAFMASPKIFKHSELPPRKLGTDEMMDFFESQDLRDVAIANNLKKISGMGYRKIALIYGSDHLKVIKELLDNPHLLDQKQEENKDKISQLNNDSLRVYRLEEGNNTSECFVASKQKKWQRVNNKKNNIEVRDT